MPSNSEDLVTSLLDTLGWASYADHPIDISRAKNPDVGLPVEKIPQPATLRALLMNYLDINFIPRRFFFSLLARFSRDDTEREKLKDLGSPAGAVRPKKN
jgi:sulfite reductase alpha subunit-like flavoprotein